MNASEINKPLVQLIKEKEEAQIINIRAEKENFITDSGSKTISGYY